MKKYAFITFISFIGLAQASIVKYKGTASYGVGGRHSDSCKVEITHNNHTVLGIHIDGLAKNWTFLSDESPIGIWFPSKEFEYEEHDFSDEDSFAKKFKVQLRRNHILLKSTKEIDLGYIKFHPKINIKLKGENLHDLKSITSDVGFKGFLSTSINCKDLQRIN